jgi:outer membrane receptor for Fe3+-dicitrate
MKKAISLMILGLMVISMFGVVVSATPVCSGNTVVGGTIYENVITNPIPNADVTVTCNSNTKTATSESNGAYSVLFSCSQCTEGNSVTVSATDGSLTGTNSGSVNMNYPALSLNVGIVNVPMVPEFGLIAGLTTVLGALGVFFVVRRK